MIYCCKLDTVHRFKRSNAYKNSDVETFEPNQSFKAANRPPNQTEANFTVVPDSLCILNVNHR